LVDCLCIVADVSKDGSADIYSLPEALHVSITDSAPFPLITVPEDDPVIQIDTIPTNISELSNI
jgi:hypothetical protein